MFNSGYAQTTNFSIEATPASSKPAGVHRSAISMTLVAAEPCVGFDRELGPENPVRP